MLKIGVTGNIGAGKSQVCRIFELLAIPVYYADPRAKALMVQDPGLVDSIKELLGQKAYIPSGELDRIFVSSIVFKDRAKLEAFNELVHPTVGHDFERWANEQQSAYCIKEAALLFESGSYKQLDHTILVVADKEIRMRRVMARDHLSENQIRDRMDKQMPQEEKMKMTDLIIDNNGPIGLVGQVLNYHRRFIRQG